MNAHTGKTRPALVAAILVAVISTITAYLAMVSFGTDVLHMPAATAYVCSGVFELSLVTVALLAREAARDTRPGGVLLGLTWGLSATSGVFAAWHELVADAPLAETLGAAAFRFLTPLLAALMWHLALIGDRHLATGASWSTMRATMRMHALFLATEDLYRVQADQTGTRTARRALARVARRRRRARAIALRSVAPDQMRAQCAAHVDAITATADADAELAALHVAHRARLAGVLTGHAPDNTPVPVPDTYADKAAAAVAAEVTDITRTTGTLSVPVSAARAGQTARTAQQATARVRTDKPRRSVRAAGPAGADKAQRLAVVSALLSDQPDVTTADALSALREAGHPVTDRTARRLLSEVRTPDNAVDVRPDNDPTTTSAVRPDTALAEVN